MNLREKYGEWGIVLGATEGVGKAFCEKLAQGGMNVVMVGRREEKLKELGESIKQTLRRGLQGGQGGFFHPQRHRRHLRRHRRAGHGLHELCGLPAFLRQDPGYPLGKA